MAEKTQFLDYYGKPLMVDLYAGLGGWAEGGLAEGYYVIGFDIERHQYGDAKYPAQLVLQDVLTIHGKQFKNAALIVASPPCQEFSYMAMPWSKAKAKRAAILEDPAERKRLTALFDACFRIQREAIEAAGHFIPLLVENVRGANEWVGRSRWNFGSFHLWGDVPALMPMVRKATKVPGFRFDGSGGSFQTASVEHTGFKSSEEGVKLASEAGRRTDKGKGARFTSRDCGDEGVKQHGSGREWFAGEGKISRMASSKSPARKAASAAIAKIPLVLSRHIAQVYKPKEI